MSARVLTVTLNPALDQTVQLDALKPGGVHRARSARIDAAGKGVNVAACLADWGLPCAATGVLGASNAAVFEAMFAARRIEDRFLRRPGDTRTNVKLIDVQANQTTDINLPGLSVDTAALAGIGRVLAAHSAPGHLAVLAGSLPSGLPEDSYVELLTEIARRGGRALLDTSGAPLSAVLGAQRDAMPYAIKPNVHELEAWAGRALVGREELIGAARALQARGIALVVVSLGEGGALFLRAGKAVHARPPRVNVNSTVGAGDAMVAGIAVALLGAADLETTARLATGFAAARLDGAGASPLSPQRVRELAAGTDVELWACESLG